ncbi:hypothetical protein FV232_17165 [Methylobacterium sp. WL30]|uniref:hypothetical protein n=1 Tax=unclassified Methylobacterium TaxID=2615210 RepID=UPI0011CC1486|nr:MULTISPECIES: hypothetical protein [unclassified Methylobacterium]TXN41711.1 hypothetical protein FV225_01585 [Methylobacterium sp. WL93]TXN51051.1 hypothetical protein FV227_09565 [Methylobacterium sp. WL119]TXN65821.1 hypothetical protein FV232_17165 [Methylobacterium sp. WL30]TXN75112.1 hypothetical protein FV228_04440 [Methylobacterium sp. WL18]
MKIILKSVPDQAEGIAVGTLDGFPLYYVGRTAHVDGRALQHGDIAEAMIDAVDYAAAQVLGGEWSKPLALVTGLNARTCNRDRIRQWGLPPWVLVLLGRASEHRHARALGFILQGAAMVYRDVGPFSDEEKRDRIGEITDPLAFMASLSKTADEMVAYARREREKAAAARGA